MLGVKNKSKTERISWVMLESCCRQLSGLSLTVAVPENLSRRCLHDNSP